MNFLIAFYTEHGMGGRSLMFIIFVCVYLFIIYFFIYLFIFIYLFCFCFVFHVNFSFLKLSKKKKKKRKQSQTHFQKIKIKHTSGSTVGNFVQFVFIVCPSRRLPTYFEINVLINIIFKKITVWNQSHCLIFCIIFAEKYFSFNIPLTNQILLPLLLEILANMCIVTTCFPVDDVINFGINIGFPIKTFPYMTKKVRTKI